MQYYFNTVAIPPQLYKNGLIPNRTFHDYVVKILLLRDSSRFACIINSTLNKLMLILDKIKSPSAVNVTLLE